MKLPRIWRVFSKPELPEFDPLAKEWGQLCQERNYAAMHVRQVALMVAEGGFSTFPVIGFDLTAAEIQEFLSIVEAAENDSDMISFVELRDQAAAMESPERMGFVKAAGYPDHFHTAGIRGFDILLDRALVGHNNDVTEPDMSVTLWGTNGPVDSGGHEVPVSEEMLENLYTDDVNVSTAFAVRGPWIWRGDLQRLSDPERRAERFLMKVAVARGMGPTIKEMATNYMSAVPRRWRIDVRTLPWWDVLAGQSD